MEGGVTGGVFSGGTLYLEGLFYVVLFICDVANRARCFKFITLGVVR